MGQWEPFTERARRSIVLAQGAMKTFDPIPNLIRPDHLFLGLLEEGESVAAVILATYGVNYKEACRVAYTQLGGARSGRINASGESAFGATSKKVIEDAFVEARAMAHNYIGTEHLLLALMANTSCELIDHLDLDRMDVCKSVKAKLRGDV